MQSDGIYMTKYMQCTPEVFFFVILASLTHKELAREKKLEQEKKSHPWLFSVNQNHQQSVNGHNGSHNTRRCIAPVP